MDADKTATGKTSKACEKPNITPAINKAATTLAMGVWAPAEALITVREKPPATL
jgi:hypothetical protein